MWVLPFTVAAEMRFGAEVAGWGAHRRRVLDRLIARAGMVPPFDEVMDAYVDVRTWSVRNGHALGAKEVDEVRVEALERAGSAVEDRRSCTRACGDVREVERHEAAADEEDAAG